SVDYYLSDYDFDDYRPAYRYGTYARSNLHGRVWDAELEQELERGWDTARGASRLDWDRHATRSGMPGTAPTGCGRTRTTAGADRGRPVRLGKGPAMRGLSLAAGTAAKKTAETRGATPPPSPLPGRPQPRSTFATLSL